MRIEVMLYVINFNIRFHLLHLKETPQDVNPETLIPKIIGE